MGPCVRKLHCPSAFKLKGRGCSHPSSLICAPKGGDTRPLFSTTWSLLEVFRGVRVPTGMPVATNKRQCETSGEAPAPCHKAPHLQYCADTGHLQ